MKNKLFFILKGKNNKFVGGCNGTIETLVNVNEIVSTLCPLTENLPESLVATEVKTKTNQLKELLAANNINNV